MLITGTARNIETYWTKTKIHLQKIFDSVDEYECVIVESNSNDNTLKLLQAWASEDSRRNVISLGYLSETSRTKRIATCRNEYLKYVSSHEYMLVVDLDDALNIDSKFKEQLASCFKRTDWDAIASNRRGPYYDIWALRSVELGISFDCWEMVQKHRTILTPTGFKNPVQHFVYDYQKVIPENSKWIECQSAFGCMALYKTAAIKGRSYNGDTCEHVSFHKGLKMFINPEFISGGNCNEHL